MWYGSVGILDGGSHVLGRAGGSVVDITLSSCAGMVDSGLLPLGTHSAAYNSTIEQNGTTHNEFRPLRTIYHDIAVVI